MGAIRGRTPRPLIFFKDHLAGITWNVVVLGLVSLFNDISSEMIVPLLPLFLTGSLHATGLWVGLIEGCAELAANGFRLAAGWISDRMAKRAPLVLGGYFLSTAAKGCFALATNAWHMLMLQFTNKLGKGIRTAPRDAMIADATGPATMGKAFGFHRSLDTIGAVIGPLLGLAIFEAMQHDYRGVFLWSVVPGLIGTFLVLATRESGRRQAAPGDIPASETDPGSGGPDPALPGPRDPTRAAFKDRRFWWLLVVVGCFSLGNSTDAFIFLRAHDLGLSVPLVLVAYAAYNAAFALFAFPAGWLSDHWGRRRMIILGFLVFAGVYAGFAARPAPAVIWGLFIAYGLFSALTDGVIRALTADLIPKNARGTAYGILNTVIGVAVLPCNLLAGWLWDHAGHHAPFQVGAGLAVLAALLLAAGPWRQPRAA